MAAGASSVQSSRFVRVVKMSRAKLRGACQKGAVADGSPFAPCGYQER